MEKEGVARHPFRSADLPSTPTHSWATRKVKYSLLTEFLRVYLSMVWIIKRRRRCKIYSLKFSHAEDTVQPSEYTYEYKVEGDARNGYVHLER